MPLVLCLCPPVGRLRRAAGCGLDPAPRWDRGVDRRCALHLRATPREATVLVSPAHLLVRALGCGQHALVDRYRGDANAVADLPAAYGLGVAGLGNRVDTRAHARLARCIRVWGSGRLRSHPTRLS